MRDTILWLLLHVSRLTLYMALQIPFTTRTEMYQYYTVYAFICQQALGLFIFRLRYLGDTGHPSCFML